MIENANALLCVFFFQISTVRVKALIILASHAIIIFFNPNIIKRGMKLLTHSQTSTVQSL